ncbi:MAG TPA: tetratricopeptide repeat protein [Opitutaceae bacterium]
MNASPRLAFAFALIAATFASAQAPSLIPLPTAEQTPPAPAPVAPTGGSSRIISAQEAVPDWQARLELARVLSYLKRWDESFVEYRRVLADRPDDHAVRQEFGQVQFWSGRTDEAIATLEAVPAAELTPEARLALADLYTARQRFDGAEALLTAHLKAQPNDDVVRFKLAELLSWQKRYDESLVAYRELLARRPADVQLRRRYALVLQWSGRLNEAAVELRRSLAP